MKQISQEKRNVFDTFKGFLKPEDKSRWVNALRSGVFPQTRGSLCRGNGYCCLGVYAEITPHVFTSKHCPHGLETDFIYSGDGQKYDQYLPEKVMPEILQCVLSELNDNSGLDFNEIADVIEEYL